VLAILDNGVSILDDMSQIGSAIGNITYLAKLAISFSRLNVSNDFLDILDELRP
jgi:hypothetical protein